MRINTFETLYSYHLLHQTRNKRAARDCLKKTVWSALLWKNKMGIMVDRKPGEGKTIFNSVHAQTSTLPRQLGENEKPFVLCMTRLFGFFRNDIENVEILTNLYFHVFIRSFSTLQVGCTLKSIYHICFNTFFNSAVHEASGHICKRNIFGVQLVCSLSSLPDSCRENSFIAETSFRRTTQNEILSTSRSEAIQSSNQPFCDRKD